MDDQTLEALKGSIRKWEKIVDGTGKDRGSDNCPLCHQFVDKNQEQHKSLSCYGCPVYEKTGHHFCLQSPYEAYTDARDQEKTEDELKVLAQAELDFLKSLVP